MTSGDAAGAQLEEGADTGPGEFVSETTDTTVPDPAEHEQHTAAINSHNLHINSSTTDIELTWKPFHLKQIGPT